MGLALAVQTHAALKTNPDLDWLRGRTIMHKIVVGLTDPSACMIAMLNELGQSSGALHSLTLKPTQGGDFEAVLHATTLSAEEARQLVSRVAAHPLVKSAAIEHVLIR